MTRPLFLSVLLMLAMVAAFISPKSKYSGLNILSQLEIPTQMPGWRSMDISNQIDMNDDRYNFISQAFARIYQNDYGEQIVFLVLDAGNFHNPKACYAASGYSVQEIEGVTFSVDHRQIKTNILDIQRSDRGIFLFYWMCIDRKIKDWAGQKITELLSSLFHHRKAGLMVRMEISSKGRTPQQAVALISEFLQALHNHLSETQREYLFGE